MVGFSFSPPVVYPLLRPSGFWVVQVVVPVDVLLVRSKSSLSFLRGPSRFRPGNFFKYRVAPETVEFPHLDLVPR